MPDFHRLDPDADAVFLRRSVADPLSRVAFRPTNAVALCATCGLVSLRETWEACGGCPNGHPEAAVWDAAQAARAAGDGARTAVPAVVPAARTAAAAAVPFDDDPPRRTGLWVALGAGALLLAALAAVVLTRDDEPVAPVAPVETAARPAALQAVPVEAGETEGTLDAADAAGPDGRYQDLYAFAADSSGRTLTFSVESSDFYPDLVVRGPDGRPLDAETVLDDEATDVRRVAVRDVRGPGVYRVLVSSRQPSATGAYTLRVRQEDVVTALPTTGRQVSGTLSAQSPKADGFFRDTYSFTGLAGREHTITLRSGAFAPTLVVTSPTGAVRSQPAPSAGGLTLRFTPDRDGAYRAVVSTRERGRTGAYTIALAVAAAPPAPAGPAPDDLPPGASTALCAGAAPVRDSLAADAQRTYVVSGRIGDRVSVEMRADGFVPVLSVVDPNGQRTAATPDGDRARVSVTLPSDGRFRVVVGGGPGTYSVSLEQRAAVTAAPIPRLPGADPVQPAPPARAPAPAGGTYQPQPIGDGR